MGIALQIVKTVDQTMNVLIIMVLAYFGIIVLSFGMRDFMDWWKRRKRSNN